MIPRFTPPVKICFLILAACTLLAACDKARLMEENQQISDAKWAYADAKAFTAQITDTSTAYNVYVNVRHSFQFEWRNVWVNIQTVFPDGRKMDKRVNLLLSEADGHWFGDCTGDNCDMQIPIQLDAWFPAPGKYSFIITQDMRTNPLANIKSIGMRIEKAGVK